MSLARNVAEPPALHDRWVPT